jgi:hypothetical protein
MYQSRLNAFIVVLLCGLWQANLSPCLGQNAANETEWMKIAPGFELAEDHTWTLTLPNSRKVRSFKFSAIRFHLGLFEMKLLSMTELTKQVEERLSRIPSDNLSIPVAPTQIPLGLYSVYKANLFDRPILALASAGFPAGEHRPVNFGLLRIDGRAVAPLAPNGPSSVFCLHSPNPKYARYKYQVPTYYKLDDKRFVNCRDAVQVGPRILEDPNTTEKTGVEGTLHYSRDGPPQTVLLGVPERDINRSPYYRTVFAVDEPGRAEDKVNHLADARNGYIIVTETSVTLWDIQDMLTSPKFYADDHYAPYFSLNLVGGDYAGMIVKSDGAEPKRLGNTDITQASMIAIMKRK